MDSTQALVLKMLAIETKNVSIKQIFATSNREYEEMRQKSGASAKQKFLGFKFRANMKLLKENLMSCYCYFVRCIKSNELKAPLRFDGKMCAEQIRSLGVLETIKMRKESYPIRRPYKVFYEKYCIVE
jgi:myosin heavy subunit